MGAQHSRGGLCGKFGTRRSSTVAADAKSVDSSQEAIPLPQMIKKKRAVPPPPVADPPAVEAAPPDPPEEQEQEQPQDPEERIQERLGSPQRPVRMMDALDILQSKGSGYSGLDSMSSIGSGKEDDLHASASSYKPTAKHVIFADAVVDEGKKGELACTCSPRFDGTN